MIKAVLAVSLALACGAPHAEARPRHKPVNACIETGNIMQPCAYQPNFLSGIKSIKVRMHRERHSAIRGTPEGQQTVVAHPAGCPSRLFCGCGAAVRVFGAPIRSLWLAANWFRFPRAAPAPGMVAVRRHHVFVLEAEIGNGLWRVYDANSGHGLTRVHPRSVVGYTIVNPHA